MTESMNIKSKYTGHDYKIFITLPYAYGSFLSRRYATAYILDSDLFTDIVAGVTRLMESHKNYPELLVVGIGYHIDGLYGDNGRLFHQIRTRDFTPAIDSTLEKAKQADLQIGKVETGGAKDFLDFLRNELIPIIEKQYRSNAKDRLLIGDSLGGLFALYSLFQEPDLFPRMIVGSPAIGACDKIIFRLEAEYAKANDDLPVDLFVGIGGEEEVLTGVLSTISVSDFYRLTSAMQSRGYRGLKLTRKVFEGNDHFEVPALIIQAGLREVNKERAV